MNLNWRGWDIQFYFPCRWSTEPRQEQYSCWQLFVTNFKILPSLWSPSRFASPLILQINLPRKPTGKKCETDLNTIFVRCVKFIPSTLPPPSPRSHRGEIKKWSSTWTYYFSEAGRWYYGIRFTEDLLLEPEETIFLYLELNLDVTIEFPCNLNVWRSAMIPK